MSISKKYIQLVSSVLLVLSNVAFGQYEEEASAKIQLVVRPMPNKILLRWGVTTPKAWKQANRFGFQVERSLISRNGNPVSPIQKEVLTGGVFLPAPLEQWKEPYDKNEFAAIIAQSIYGDSFETTQMDPLQTVMAVNQELEQRFTFAMLAAEQSFEAAKLAGWGYEDTDVQPGDKYLYSISVMDNAGVAVAEKGTMFTGVDFHEALPSPAGFNLFFNENKAELNWNYSALQETYSSYIVERSEEGTAFKQINKYPIFNAEIIKPGKQISLGYTDSIPNNKAYYYRIKGINAFGQKGPASKVLKGKATERLKFVPYITGKKMKNDSTVVLQWTFDKKANHLLKGFQLVRSNNDRTDFKKVVENIKPEQRSLTYTKLKRINYFKIIAVAKNGDQRPSYPVIVQPVDSIPPSIPKGLQGTIDTTGVVRLKWAANKEFDLKGYRVFRANNKNDEFAPVTKSLVNENEFTDTINVKNLNKQIHYKIWAEDERYNASKLSEVLSIDKPDLFPPTPVVITKYDVIDNTVSFSWVKSSSDDVAAYEVYRKEKKQADLGWEFIAKVEASVLNYNDKTVPVGNYEYTIIAKDNTGLESSPCQPIQLSITQQLGEKIITRFNVTPNRELRTMFISWKTSTEDIAELLLYKSTVEGNLSLFKTFPANINRYEDKDLKINTTYTYALKAILKTGIESKLEQIKVTY